MIKTVVQVLSNRPTHNSV